MINKVSNMVEKVNNITIPSDFDLEQIAELLKHDFRYGDGLLDFLKKEIEESESGFNEISDYLEMAVEMYNKHASNFYAVTFNYSHEAVLTEVIFKGEEDLWKE